MKAKYLTLKQLKKECRKKSISSSEQYKRRIRKK